MGRCTLCKKEVDLPFTCSYCGQTFCSEHRLPENHRCPGLPKRDWKNYKKKTHHKKWHTLQVEKKDEKPLDSIPIHGLEPKKKFKPKYRRLYIFLIIIIGIIGVLYLADPKGFTNTLEKGIDNPSSLLSNLTESISSIPKNVTIPKTIWQPKNVYGNYSFGLVKNPRGVTINSYGDYVVLINNHNSKNPTYNQLINFLKNDKTDAFPYIYVITNVETRYGSAESHVNISYIKEIIDGTEKMRNPRICADFAKMLHNKAELAGHRCGYVSIDLTGYSDPYNLGISSNTSHALVVFNTTDKGLIFIDDTGTIGSTPSNCDKIVRNLEVGNDYIPESLFPEPGWKSKWKGRGKITSIKITWDGEWN